MPYLNFYLNKIRNLNRNPGMPAPHKTLLILAAIDLIEQGEVTNNQIAPTPNLLKRFRTTGI